MAIKRERNMAADDFSPPALLKNRHIQTLLASVGPRRLFTRYRAQALHTNSRLASIACGAGVQLLGAYCPSKKTDKKQLTILIHGWEGSIESSYLLSAAATLYEAGHSIFRLNLRDHGDSHHLNEPLFHSARLDEVANAIIKIKESYPHQRVNLVGFSLGGNFCIRLACHLAAGIIERVAVISPLIDPAKTTDDLERGWRLYHYYFIRKWRKSLKKKLSIFPDHQCHILLSERGPLSEMNMFFVAQHTPFESREDYYLAYTIDNELLKNTSCCVDILVSKDDPIVKTQWLERLECPKNIMIKTVASGGHCGFIKDYRFNCFADEWLTDKLA
tara:strand:- start:2770 stop:3762 length:993 start_codon:yes stop_codon:yes gene_type:complete